MRRHPNENVADSKQTTQSEYEEAAALAEKILALSPHLEPRAGRSPDRAHAGSHTASRANGLWGRLFYLLVWLGTLVLIAVALLRIFDYDGTHFLIWLNAFTRYIYLPAYACLAWAAWMRRWWLALANLAIVGLHIAWIAPDFVRDRRFDLVAGQSAHDAIIGPRVRIFFANVKRSNTEYDSLLREIKSADPDIVILVEFSARWRQAFLDSSIMAAYPYGTGLQAWSFEQVNVFSKLPVKSETQVDVVGRIIRTLEIPVGSQLLHLIGLHAPRPMQIANDYEGYWARAVPMLLAEMGPLIIVGDCNATQYSLVYKRLTADRLRSAHDDRGRGYATSWPNGVYWLPPIRIDQAFLSPEVECLGVSEGEGRGSDHKPLILDIQLRGNR